MLKTIENPWSDISYTFIISIAYVLAHIFMISDASATGAIETRPSAKTTDVLVIVGTRKTDHFDRDDSVIVRGRRIYYAIGTILLWAHRPPEQPVKILAYGRGADVLFFDPAPLRGAFSELEDVKKLRKLLIPEYSIPVSNTDSNDLEKLKEVIDSDSEDKNELDRGRRRYAFKMMKQYGLTNFEKLLERCKADDEFIRYNIRDRISIKHSFSAEEKSDSSTSPLDVNKQIDLTSILNNPSKHGLSALLRTTIFSGEISRIIGYIVVAPADEAGKHGAELVIKANDTEPSRIPIELYVDEPITSIPYLFRNFVPGIVSIFFGAGFALGGGYLAFRLQQRFIRERVERDQFEARKVEYSSTLWDFFQGDTYSNLMAGDNDLEIVQEVRRYMIEKGIYPLLPNESLKLLNRLCDETKKSKESRSELLDSNLKIHFKEFLF